jgi:hypothetical protein
MQSAKDERLLRVLGIATGFKCLNVSISQRPCSISGSHLGEIIGGDGYAVTADELADKGYAFMSETC